MPLSWPSNKLNMSAGRAPSLQFLIWSGLKKKIKKNQTNYYLRFS